MVGKGGEKVGKRQPKGSQKAAKRQPKGSQKAAKRQDKSREKTEKMVGKVGKNCGKNGAKDPNCLLYCR
jgi:hypothetical protein